MTITQTVEVPASRRVTIDVPLFDKPLPGGSARTVEEALRMAEEKRANPNRKPLSQYFGILSPDTYGDGVAYQRAIRDEWDD